MNWNLLATVGFGLLLAFLVAMFIFAIIEAWQAHQIPPALPNIRKLEQEERANAAIAERNGNKMAAGIHQANAEALRKEAR